ncbi:cysteine hydrolase [Microbacterium esteraromaticum]|uniref:cysteine hydrolase family protein n=1 Tax=Microbacterium esteraromaticum TaxID=57043 RepID=UPI001CD80340|nr:cysteine hydrolase [Microbacterium esteraromaticum]MCA1307839.1 cysteine hydrolase [Microbacterium esteraromaticum]
MNPLDPTRTAFIAVHLQNDIVAEGGAFAPIFADELERNLTIQKAGELLDVARAAGAFVVFARVGFRSDYRDMVANVPLLQMAKASNALVNDTWQTEITRSLDVAEDDLVLTHTRTSPFHASPLDALLRQRNINNVVVLGVATNASVEDAARTAANLGYRTVVACDASSAATVEAHEAALASFALFGEVATNAQIRGAIGRVGS